MSYMKLNYDNIPQGTEQHPTMASYKQTTITPHMELNNNKQHPTMASYNQTTITPHRN